MAYAAKVDERHIAEQFDHRGMLGGTTEPMQHVVVNQDVSAGVLDVQERNKPQVASQRQDAGLEPDAIDVTPKEVAQRDPAPKDPAPKIAYQGPKFPTNGMG